MPNLKLPGHRPGLPGKEIPFQLCPLTPPIPLWRDGALAGQISKSNLSFVIDHPFELYHFSSFFLYIPEGEKKSTEGCQAEQRCPMIFYLLGALDHSIL